MKTASLIFIAVTVALLGFVSGHQLTYEKQPAQRTTIPAPLPQSMDELVSESSLIVVASPGPALQEIIFYGYDEHAEERKEIEAETGVMLGREIIDYPLQIQEVLKDTDGIDEKTVTLRLFQNHDEELRYLSRKEPRQDEQRLLFLALNPDGQTYGLRSDMHQIILDEDHAVYPVPGEMVAPFGLRLEIADFTNQIMETVARQAGGERR